MRIIGSPDQANKDFVPGQQLQAWHESGVIEWQAHRDDMPQAWQETDIAVFPTFYGEGIPLALLEAAASALPIIATDIAGCRDLIENDQTGLLIEPQNAAAIAEAITALLSDPDKARRLSQAVREQIDKDYSAEKITLKTREILEQICP
jgi:glycosyltransferase involved in cell wall biosynthesis